MAGFLTAWLFGSIGLFSLFMGNIFVSAISLFVWWKIIDRLTEDRYYPSFVGDLVVVVIGIIFFGAIFSFSEIYFLTKHFSETISVSRIVLLLLGYIQRITPMLASVGVVVSMNE